MREEEFTHEEHLAEWFRRLISRHLLGWTGWQCLDVDVHYSGETETAYVEISCMRVKDGKGFTVEFESKRGRRKMLTFAEYLADKSYRTVNDVYKILKK